MAMMWSPSTTAPGVVDGDQPVGVAVEGQAGVGPFRHHLEPQVLGMGGAATVIDVATIGVVVDDDDVGTEALEGGRGDRLAAPLAQSSTSVRPSRRWPARMPVRCST